LEIKKYAAIDIGSNGVRLLVSNVIVGKDDVPVFRKSALVRVPIRLGADTFEDGSISKYNAERMCKAMKAFELLMQIHGVEKYRACATSAMREADNGQEVVDKIAKETGVRIEIIDGKTEAAIIASTDLYELINGKKNYLYVDVGGGSTEFTFFSHGKLMESKSFRMGTVRALDSKYDFSEAWDAAKKWVKSGVKKYSKCTIIGSGGNINKIFKLSGTKLGKPLELAYLKGQYQLLKKISYDERVRVMGLNPDRADVIVPALKIYIAAMEWAKADRIIVPKIGLSDGIVKMLYDDSLPQL
jgi:exopolyphosphatase/guanosine-5'-triphosphate,3'-diphosphate pyrophosphatase